MTKKTFSNYSIQVNRSSGQTRAVCPMCSAHRKKKTVKCLSVNIDDGLWLCHHCGWSGGLKEGVQEKSNPCRHVPYRRPEPIPVAIPPKVLEWFESRRITREVLVNNGITFTQVYMPQIEGDTGAIAFPYLKGGEVVNYKYRDAHKNFRQEPGAEKLLYGLDNISGREEAIICEGEIDTLSIQIAGFTNCVSVPDGAPAPNTRHYESKFDYLQNCSEAIDNLKRIIIAVDNDPPGHHLEEELVRRLGAGRCWRVRWPGGCKDANDVLVRYGREVLNDAIRNAAPVPVEGIFSPDDLLQEVITLYDGGLHGGDSPGWKNLERHYTVRPGEFTVITGIPGHGKSSWLDHLLVNLSNNKGWRIAIFSPENQPLARHVAKIASIYTGRPFSGSGRMTEQELAKALKWMSGYFNFILPPDDNMTVEGILDLAKIDITRRGTRGIVLDPWNEIEHTRPQTMTETEYISHALSRIRRFARAQAVHIWVVAHPTKMRCDADGKHAVPTPYDISGSANWYNKADCCITVWRDTDNEVNRKGEVEIHIPKIRFREVGRPGLVRLYFDESSGRFYEDEKRPQFTPLPLEKPWSERFWFGTENEDGF